MGNSRRARPAIRFEYESIRGYSSRRLAVCADLPLLFGTPADVRRLRKYLRQRLGNKTEPDRESDALQSDSESLVQPGGIRRACSISIRQRGYWNCYRTEFAGGQPFSEQELHAD